MASSRVSGAVSAPEPPFEGVGTATGGHYTGPCLTAWPPENPVTTSLEPPGALSGALPRPQSPQ